jgi:small subunit ribosomal protein S17
MAQAKTAPKARDIGIEVAAPAATCTDVKCPFHGHLKVRGAQIVGKVTSTRMEHTVVVEKEHVHYDRKFERYERRSRKYSAHHPPCLTLHAGDEVRIMECRPISKTVSFVVVEKRGGAAQ